MKKVFLLMAMVAFVAACSSSTDAKEESTEEAVTEEAATPQEAISEEDSTNAALDSLTNEAIDEIEEDSEESES